MEKGFIRLSRKFFENDIWKVARTYNESEAWLDLIQSARFEASEQTARVGGREITWGQGQYPASVRFLATRWHWSQQRTRSFLTKLKKRGMIRTECQQGMNIITLVNYRQYNCPDETESTVNTPACTPINEESCAIGNTASNTLKMLIRTELQELLTQQATHSQSETPDFPSKTVKTAEKSPKKQHSGNTKNKKGKNIITTGDNNIPQEKETSPDGEAKKDELSLSPSSEERIDFDGLQAYFNRLFSGRLSSVRSLTETRRRAVKARVAQYGKEAVMTVFRLVSESPFLLGANDRGWRADFDWIFKQQNFTKILEGTYNHDTPNHPAAARRESVSRLKDLATRILQDACPTDDTSGVR